METGHAINIENFTIEITACQGYTTRYQPSNSKLKIPHLLSVKTAATTAMQTITAQATPRLNILIARHTLFSDLSKYATRIVCALKSSENMDQHTVDYAMTFVRKIHGERKSKKILNPTPADPKQISASQRSYTNQVEFYSKLINFVLVQPTYLPYETDLQETALTTYETQLHNANTAAIDVNISWNNALIARNQILYAPKTGLVDLALAVKKYVQSVKTITKVEYSLISYLKFHRPPK